MYEMKLLRSIDKNLRYARICEFLILLITVLLFPSTLIEWIGVLGLFFLAVVCRKTEDNVGCATSRIFGFLRIPFLRLWFLYVHVPFWLRRIITCACREEWQNLFKQIKKNNREGVMNALDVLELFYPFPCIVHINDAKNAYDALPPPGSYQNCCINNGGPFPFFRSELLKRMRLVEIKK